jgi:Cytochrome bd terminal oxidase subunit I
VPRTTGTCGAGTRDKVFALTFALGVVSGITMSFPFGTHWPGFMKTVGNTGILARLRRVQVGGG